MNLDDRARASAQALLGSVARVDPVASLDQLLRRRRRRLAGRAALALATATMVAVVAWVGIRELQQPTVVTQPGSLGRVTATIPVGADPSDVLVSQGAIWVAAGQSVSRIDPATATTTSMVAVGPRPRLAAGFGSGTVAIYRAG